MSLFLLKLIEEFKVTHELFDKLCPLCEMNKYTTFSLTLAKVCPVGTKMGVETELFQAINTAVI